MKNNLWLFERTFKIPKNGIFLFEISFFVLEILTFFYFANQISDDFILFATKKWKLLNKRYLWKYCRWWCVNKKKILSFVLKQNTSTSTNLIMEVKTIWELCLFQVGLSVSFYRLQMGIFSFLTERDWSRNSCYNNSTNGVILFLS